MATIDEGQGDAIVFQHGNPTSSYLWRNIMPFCKGMGRLIAPDLIGMGESDKLDNSSAESYSYVEHREYLHALYEELDLGDSVILVLHDWGSALGFDWANQNRDRIHHSPGRTGLRTPEVSFRLFVLMLVSRWLSKRICLLSGCCLMRLCVRSMKQPWRIITSRF